MNDKISFVPDSVKEAVDDSAKTAGREIKKGLKETLSQILGIGNTESQKKQERTKELTEKAEKSGRTVEEQAKVEALRRQLHQQVTAPRPKEPEQDATEQEDKVGTNEQMQSIGNKPKQDPNAPPPLAQPSQRHGEKLKIRE